MRALGPGRTLAKQPGTPSCWLAYIDVDDIQALTKRAKELGGKVMLDVTEVGDFVFISVITRWVDEQGVMRLTDNADTVPEEFRKQAKR